MNDVSLKFREQCEYWVNREMIGLIVFNLVRLLGFENPGQEVTFLCCAILPSSLSLLCHICVRSKVLHHFMAGKVWIEG